MLDTQTPPTSGVSKGSPDRIMVRAHNLQPLGNPKIIFGARLQNVACPARLQKPVVIAFLKAT